MLRKTSERYQHIGLLVDASMRPQRNAAENGRIHCGRPGRCRASMRPQRNAAENTPSRHHSARVSQSFNEAAA